MDYRTIDDDVVWAVMERHAPQLRRDLADEIEATRAAGEDPDPPESSL